MKHTLADIADRLGAVIEGDGSLVIRGVAGLREAQPGDLTFFANPRYASHLRTTRATAVLVTPEFDGSCAAALLRTENPDKAFQKVAALFAPAPVIPPPGVHPSAVVAKDARLGSGAIIGPHVVVEPGAVLGDRCWIGAGCYIGHGVVVGDDGRLFPHVSVREHCRLGDRVTIHNGSVIGSDGFGYDADEEGVRTKIPQIGIVQIRDDVEIGANVTIDRARFGRTYIGHGVKIDNLVQIAHNVVVEDHAVIVAQVGISGSSVVGAHTILAGQSGVAGHVTIGPWAVVGGRAGVTKDVPPKVFVIGFPAAPHEKAARIQAHVNRLPHLKERVAELEQRIKELEDRDGA